MSSPSPSDLSRFLPCTLTERQFTRLLDARPVVAAWAVRHGCVSSTDRVVRSLCDVAKRLTSSSSCDMEVVIALLRALPRSVRSCLVGELVASASSVYVLDRLRAEFPLHAVPTLRMFVAAIVCGRYAAAHWMRATFPSIGSHPRVVGFPALNRSEPLSVGGEVMDARDALAAMLRENRGALDSVEPTVGCVEILRPDSLYVECLRCRRCDADRHATLLPSCGHTVCSVCLSSHGGRCSVCSLSPTSLDRIVLV